MSGFLTRVVDHLRGALDVGLQAARAADADRRAADRIVLPRAEEKKTALYGVGMPSDLSSPAAMATAMYLNGACTARHAVLMGAAGAPDGRGGFRMAYGGRGR